MKVKVRISYFISTKISLTAQTRPVPRSFQPSAEITDRNKLSSRASLSARKNQKIVLAVPKTKTKKCIKKSVVTKTALERQILNLESSYAATPKRQFSDRIKQQIQLEVNLMRHNASQQAIRRSKNSGRCDCE